ncbi:hypothetical protein [Desulfonatronum thioautotrophicum]|uniref:hypothetical protein n=1 Tax=Desulfonatronum thioautotrophicum TaxID=617001 RepID=UPI0006993C58|nr:hypothetical protein [Desulfonatronum thioautotrophicum]
MQKNAAEYVAFFDFDIREGEAYVTLSPKAPQGLLDLVQAVCGTDTECLVCLFEALNCIAEADDLQCCPIDEKICPPEFFRNVLAFLGADAQG